MNNKQLLSLSEEQKLNCASIYMLQYINEKKDGMAVWLEADDAFLEPILEKLMAKDHLEIKTAASGEKSYFCTQKGREALRQFDVRYREFLKVFDVFSAVDLEKGEFAFSRYYDFDSSDAWLHYLNDARWDDLRLAVAEHKGLDVIDVVFMNFLSEERFGRDSAGWQFDLLLGSVWDEMLNICRTCIDVKELGYRDSEGDVGGEEVIADVIEQGTEIMLKLLKQEKNIAAEDDAALDDPEDVEAYEAYREPTYASPRLHAAGAY